MKFKLKNATFFGWDGLKGWSYNSKDDFSNASATYFEITGKHGMVLSTISDRIYLILDGKGEFVVDGELIPVEKTDVVIIPKDTPYDYQAKGGVLKLFLVHSPAFDDSADIKLK
jgi:mannose-6-phosphate isomerase-like protein (cupin superfamily)